MQQLERDLTDVLRRRAEGVPDSAVARLCAATYHPRTRRMSPRLTAGAIGGAVATTATVATVVSVVGAPVAFAGWKAAPTVGTDLTTSTAQATCSSQITQLAQIAHKGSTPGTSPTSAATSTWLPVASDVRGPYTIVVYDGPVGQATCLTSKTFTSVSEASRSGASQQTTSTAGGSGVRTGSAGVLGSGALGSGLAPLTEMHSDVSGQGSYTLVDGQVPQTVTTVTLARTSGAAVQATTNDGWFVAWWPGTASATSATLTSPAGTTTTPLSFGAHAGDTGGTPAAT